MKTHLHLLNKLLWQGKGKWLIGGALTGAFLGFWLLLSAIQFYCDVQKLLGGDTNPGDRFVSLNKKVSLRNTLGAKAAFSAEEIAQIEAQPFVEAVGKYEANDFKAGAYSDLLGFYTELFFEAVPTGFLDNDDPDFRWSVGQKELPILISKDYLALYNFGFAPSQGLPQFTPSAIRRLALDIKISGNGREQTFSGRVVGFSDRINSILVPSDFMHWANTTFGSGEQAGASRLLLEVDNPMSKDFRDFLKHNGYELSAGRLIGSQFGVLLQVVLVVVSGFGVLILLLSTLVMALNFQLIIAQNTPDIQLLMEIGYPPRQIAGVLNRRFVLFFSVVIIAVFAAVFALRYWMTCYFERQGFELSLSLHPAVWAASFLLSILLCSGMYFNIRRSIYAV